MALQILPKESAVKADPSVKMLIDFLVEKENDLNLSSAVVFHNFPLFREDERLLVAELVVVSPWHGVLLISTVKNDSDRLEGAFSQIFSRLVKYPRLRAGRAQLKFNLDAFVWLPEGDRSDEVKVGNTELSEYFKSTISNNELDSDIFNEILSVLDGSKALIRAKDRKTDGFEKNSKISIIAKLEEEIRKFDRDQRVAYMTEVTGPQRIRGLAGSGKTVVLALKAALTAVREPDAKIAVTFYTKSLYQHIRQLITRFYRLHEDRDPDWSKVQVLHAWGGATVDGLYYKTARRFGHSPISYTQALNYSPSQPFAYACKSLLEDSTVKDTYDYVFVDEAQDFPPEFMQLALRLAIDENLVIAYDVFQTIFDVEVPTAASLFGVNESGESEIFFNEDVILHKCYRNPREILVCAHAIGFGIYGSKIVQMLESEDHWKDFGYKLETPLIAGHNVSITRPSENSPSSVSESNTVDQIIHCEVLPSASHEINHVVARIKNEIDHEGVSPEDILIICLDDRNSRVYFSGLKRALQESGIQYNDLQEDSYSVRDFQSEGCITLSTIYKAKGNEAYSVYLVGVDSLFHSPNAKSRNKVFTAMTRAKGWLYITGTGETARKFKNELESAKRNFPNLNFVYPTPEEIVYMKRDLVEVDIASIDDDIDRLSEGVDPEDFEKILRKKLREVQAMKRVKKRLK
ncbi:MAG: ATP-binding domain-containing protein [Comamonas sp.]|jgi:superfamily I DNA and RNA helicase|nr:ATP-binding domain-containing protein [Comamonas sp.]